MPDLLAPVCRDRVVCRTRFSSWDGLLATDHERIPDPHACCACFSCEATPGLWSIPDRIRRFSGDLDRQVLFGIESAYVRRCGSSHGRIRVEWLAQPSG